MPDQPLFLLTSFVSVERPRGLETPRCCQDLAAVERDLAELHLLALREGRTWKVLWVPVPKWVQVHLALRQLKMYTVVTSKQLLKKVNATVC